jgi:hypothetical protein
MLDVRLGYEQGAQAGDVGPPAKIGVVVIHLKPRAKTVETTKDVRVDEIRAARHGESSASWAALRFAAVVGQP